MVKGKRVIVNGALGKMGQLAAITISKHADFELVGALGRGDNLKEAIIKERADIVVDLTNAASVYQNTLTIINQGAHPVIGSSGLMAEDLHYLQHIAEEKKLGGLIVPNFSIAALVMMQSCILAAKFFPEVEIIEMHHQEKLDAPSGTAIKTAESILQARKDKPQASVATELLRGARGALMQDIPIHSVRLPGIVAKQEVIFGAHGETLTISHQSIDRASFMPGLILACQQVSQMHALHYGLETCLAW